MATLAFDGTAGSRIVANPITNSINAIPNGASTIAVLCRVPDATSNYAPYGLNDTDPPGGEAYHGMEFSGGDTGFYFDDDGIVGSTWNGSADRPTGAGGGNFFIHVTTKASGTVTERIHVSSAMSAAESWVHENATGNNGGNRAGPGLAGGFFLIGNFRAMPFKGDIALIGIWAGTNMSDADTQALWVNKKTSDWYNHSAGTPDTLIELTSLTPEDIGSDPIDNGDYTFTGGITATGSDPQGWTFDGTGAPDTGLAWIRA